MCLPNHSVVMSDMCTPDKLYINTCTNQSCYTRCYGDCMNDYCMYSKYYIGNKDGMMAEHSGIGEFSGEAAD